MTHRLNRDAMIRHAEDWIAAWNRRDLAAVLESYAEDACFRSPKAVAIAGSSLVIGKPAMERYWRAALDRIGALRFTLLSPVCDVEAQVLVVHYLAALDGPPRRACEVFRFEGGRKTHGEALYGSVEEAEAAAPPGVPD